LGHDVGQAVVHDDLDFSSAPPRPDLAKRGDIWLIAHLRSHHRQNRNPNGMVVNLKPPDEVIE
jgi:hypothetical protein